MGFDEHLGLPLVRDLRRQDIRQFPDPRDRDVIHAKLIFFIDLHDDRLFFQVLERHRLCRPLFVRFRRRPSPETFAC